MSELVVELKGDLLDIEMALQQTLEAARSQYFGEIKKINDEMAQLQSEAFGNISAEYQGFGIKLKEELNKEKELFQSKIEQDMQATLETYNVETLEQGIGTVVDVLIDESKDAVDELVTLFIEKIDGEALLKDGAITRGRNGEWNARTTEIIEAQHTRGRQII